MVEVEVDGDACVGSANCVSLAEGAFALNAEGVAECVDPRAVSLDELKLAERTCPTAAITVRE